MAHEYAKEAKASHDRKLASYGGKSKTVSSTVDGLDKEGDATNFAGEKALNTNKQAGRAPLNSQKYEAPEVRVQKKKGGSVMGGQSLKRLDKAPRGKAPMKGTGQRKGPVPTGTTEQVQFDETTKFAPGAMNERSMRKCGGRMKKEDGGGSFLKRMIGGPKSGSDLSGVGKETTSRYSDEDKAGLKSRMEGSDEMPKDERDITAPYKKGGAAKKRAAGGPAKHDDEAMDRALIKKMVKKDDLTGKSCGGRMAKAGGGGAFSDYGAGSSGHSKGGKKSGAKTNVTIMIGAQPNPSMATPQGAGAGLPPGALEALLGAAGAGGPPPAPPMAPPAAPGAMPPGAGAPPPMMAAAPPPMMPPPGAGGPPPGAPPMMRKDGGKVQVPYKKPGRKGDYPAMDFGSGGGFGRKQKIDAYGTKMGGGKA